MMVINVAADGTITIDEERSQIAVVSVEGGTSATVQDGQIIVTTTPTIIYVNTSGIDTSPAPVVYTALLISGSSLDILNRYVDVSFDPNVYHSSGGALLAADLQIVFAQNGGVATACSISSLTTTSGGALSGGEQVVRVNLSFTGDPSGVETITIKPSAQGTYKDASGNLVSANDTTGAISVFKELDPLYKAGVALALTNSFTVPILAQRLIDNALFVYYRTQGILLELDFLFLFTANNNFSRINFINTTVQGAFTGTVTITQFSGGIASAGGYFSTGWDPLTNAVKYLQNDSSIWIVIGNNGQVANLMIGARGSGAGVNFGHVRIQGRNTSDVSGGAININNSGNAFAPAMTNAEGLHGVSREASNLSRYYLNGTELTNGATASSTLTDKDIYVWSENQNGTASTSNNVHEGMAAFGGSGMQDKITELNTGAQTWKTDTNALIPSIIADRYYRGMGQSNLNGGGCLLSSLSPAETALYNNGPISMANGYAADCWVKTEEGDDWALLEAGVNGVTGAGGTGDFSPIFPFAVMEATKYPGKQLYFSWRPTQGSWIVRADGTSDWKDGGVPSSSWMKFKANDEEGISMLSSVLAYAKPIFDQGESAATDLTRANNYQTDQSAFLSQCNSQLSGAPTVASFIIKKNGSWLSALSYPYNSTVRTAQVNNQVSLGYTLIDVDALDHVSPHISPASAIIAYAQLLSNAS